MTLWYARELSRQEVAKGSLALWCNSRDAYGSMTSSLRSTASVIVLVVHVNCSCAACHPLAYGILSATRCGVVLQRNIRQGTLVWRRALTQNLYPHQTVNVFDRGLGREHTQYRLLYRAAL